MSSSKYGRLSSSFQAVNPIFHFMITSSKPAMVCSTTLLKDKRLKTESRLVTSCQQEREHAIKRQFETEGSFLFSGSCLITGLWAGKSNSWISASYTNTLTGAWRWWVTNSWMNWHEGKSFHVTLPCFSITNPFQYYYFWNTEECFIDQITFAAVNLHKSKSAEECKSSALQRYIIMKYW